MYHVKIFDELESRVLLSTLSAREALATIAAFRLTSGRRDVQAVDDQGQLFSEDELHIAAGRENYR